MKKTRRNRRTSGNALIEYAVPTAVLLIGAGVLAQASDVTSSIAGYFLAASGNSSANVSNGVLKSTALSGIGATRLENGSQGFVEAFASLEDGQGNILPTTANGKFYSGAVARTGSRPTPTSAEYLYP